MGHQVLWQWNLLRSTSRSHSQPHKQCSKHFDMGGQTNISQMKRKCTRNEPQSTKSDTWTSDSCALGIAITESSQVESFSNSIWTSEVTTSVIPQDSEIFELNETTSLTLHNQHNIVVMISHEEAFPTTFTNPNDHQSDWKQPTHWLSN